MEKVAKLSYNSWGENTPPPEHRTLIIKINEIIDSLNCVSEAYSPLAIKINEIIDSLDSKSEVTTIKPLDYIVTTQDIGLFPEGWAFKYNPIYKKYYSHPDGEKACSLSIEIVKKYNNKFTQLIDGSYVDNEGKIKKAINLDDWLEKDCEVKRIK